MTTPGWYTDPSEPTLERYFDGTAWTRQVRPREPEQAGARHRSIGRIALFVVASVATLAAAAVVAVAVLSNDVDRRFDRERVTVTDGRGTAPTDRVLAALRRHGIECDAAPTPRPSGAQLLTVLAAIPPVAPGSDDVRKVRSAVSETVQRLDTGELDVVTCGRSTVLAVGDRAHLVVLVGTDPAAASSVGRTGVRVAFLRPPRVEDVADVLDDEGGRACKVVARSVTRAVLVAQTAARAATGGAPVTPAESDVLSHLPESGIAFSDCGDATVAAVDGWALAVILAPGSEHDPRALAELGPVDVAGP